MPTSTYDLLASNVLSSNTASVTFSSIPSSGYRDLVLVFYGLATTSSEANIEFRLNGDTTNSYFGVTAEADKNNNVTSGSYTNTRFFEAINDGTLSNSGANFTMFQIFDYTENKHKSIFSRSNNPEFLGVDMLGGRWLNTSVVNSITVIASGTAFASGASFYLYGITA